MRATTDASGAVTSTADYSVFGEVRARTGQASVFGYTGEQADASGLTYLRARQYDPGLGRFLSADTVQPNAPGTQGYNRYAYVANNPTTWTDPTGHMAETALRWAPRLLPMWFLIGIMLAQIYIAYCAQHSPTGICAPLAAFVIVVTVVVACVIEVGGPCWGWLPLSYVDSTPKEHAASRERAEPIARAQPMPTPPSKPDCIDNPWPGDGPAPQWNQDFPPVSNSTLKNFINQLFKSGDSVPGGTAGAIRQELATGKRTGGKWHTLKGEQVVQGLSRLIKTGRLSATDRAIAEWLENDLLNALSGC